MAEDIDFSINLSIFKVLLTDLRGIVHKAEMVRFKYARENIKMFVYTQDIVQRIEKSVRGKFKSNMQPGKFMEGNY